MAKIDAMRPRRRIISQKQFQSGGNRLYGRGPVGMNCVGVPGASWNVTVAKNPEFWVGGKANALTSWKANGTR